MDQNYLHTTTYTQMWRRFPKYFFHIYICFPDTRYVLNRSMFKQNIKNNPLHQVPSPHQKSLLSLPWGFPPLCVHMVSSVQSILKNAFFTFVYFSLKNNYYTMFCWFLPYTNMTQPQYTHVPSLLKPPPPPHPTRLGRHRALVWAPEVTLHIPTGCLSYTW